MRSYEDISNRIMERGNKLIDEREVRAAKIRHTSYAVSGMCAAAIAGIGVWHIAANIKKPDDGFNGSGIVSAIEIVTESTTTSEITAAVTTTAEKTTAAVKTTAVTTDKKNSETTSANTAAKTAPRTTAAMQTTSAKASNVSATTTRSQTNETADTKAPVTTIVTDAPVPVTTTLRPVSPEGNSGNTGNTGNTGEESARITTTAQNEDGLVTTSSVYQGTAYVITTTVPTGASMGDGNHMTATTTSLQDVFRANPSYFKMNGIRYEKQTTVEAESVGEYFRRVDMHIVNKRQEIKAVMKSYLIDNIDTEEAVAVRLNDTDEYYLFRNISYKKDEDE